MKIQFKRDIEVETASGHHCFEPGDIVTVDYEDACQLVQAGFAIPHHSLDIARKLAQMRPEDVAMLNEITTLFDGSIVATRKLPAPFDVTRCHDRPAPHGNCCNPSPTTERGFRQSYVMKVGPDGTLGVFCLKGGAFCPHSISRKPKGGDEDMIVSEKEKAVR